MFFLHQEGHLAAPALANIYCALWVSPWMHTMNCWYTSGVAEVQVYPEQ